MCVFNEAKACLISEVCDLFNGIAADIRSRIQTRKICPETIGRRGFQTNALPPACNISSLKHACEETMFACEKATIPSIAHLTSPI
jgi:hypothetical protein